MKKHVWYSLGKTLLPGVIKYSWEICLIFVRQNTLEENHCRQSREGKKLWKGNNPDKNICEVETFLKRLFARGILMKNTVEEIHCRKSEEENIHWEKIPRGKIYLSWKRFYKISFQGKYSQWENSQSRKILLEGRGINKNILYEKLLEKRNDAEGETNYWDKIKVTWSANTRG